ncbi:N-oxygenase [Burkholderia multivorans]|uniref:N-oxygenase n=1 Tax=Burkholderia multivorans TaxID=87883 RepID=A0ABD7L9T2_9BURK|nr:diiron oxygenase [Burkholderia multivorans]SAJ92920.1 N-oxygenase [Burkholderia multivorans]SAJ98011.1 N-oxygenase [Burkholderia multivorans]HEF5155338.1 diiron oxygenase [Burkholderia multivorans]
MNQAEENHPAPDGAISAWYEKATVRYTPRIIVPDYTTDALIYPTALSIICEHPLVVARGKEIRSFILTQSAYRFLYGVGLLETKFVIQCSLDLVHDRIFPVDDVERLQALTVIIDEGYHAHVALDYIVQMRAKSGIAPLSVPQTNRKLDATARVYATLPPELRMDFQLLAVTLAENVLTNEIATMGREKELTKSYITLMTDHVMDEGRHSNYFNDLMRKRWAQLDATVQSTFGTLLPAFLDDFLGIDPHRAFEREMLGACGFPSGDVQRILDDTQETYSGNHAAVSTRTKARLFRLAKTFGILNRDDVRDAFAARGYAFQ